MADFTSYTAKLEPFLLMSKSAKGAAAAKLVQDATTSPGLFVFAQLLELPNIKEVTYIPYSIILGPCLHAVLLDAAQHKSTTRADIFPPGTLRTRHL